MNCAGQDRLLCGAHNRRELGGVTQTGTYPPAVLSALVGQAWAASSLLALLMCSSLLIFALGSDS